VTVRRQRTAAAARPAPCLTLFRIAFRHDYYNAAAGRCPDFAIVPTDAAAALIKSVGLLVRSFDDGFDILLPRDRQAALAAALARDPQTRLGFLLYQRNPDFIGFTALPIDTCPTRQALHVSNLVTNGSDRQRRFGTSATVDGTALLPLTGAGIPVDAAVSGTVRAADLCGNVVASVDVVAGTPATLSLVGLPPGAYAIKGTPRAAWTGAATFALMPGAPPAFGLIDLLLAAPAGTDAGAAAFPCNAGLPVRTVAIDLCFAARPTYWTYYVVAQGAGTLAPDLAISAGNASAGTLAFTRSPARLPNGDAAMCFTADRPQPMQQRPAAHFSLSGQRGNARGQQGDISINRLPGAPVAPVWPARQPGAGISEIFVYL
jgi:hypothetical protein